MSSGELRISAEQNLGHGWRYVSAAAGTLHQRRCCREMSVRVYARNIRSRYVLAISSGGDRYSIPPDAYAGEVRYLPD